MKTNKLVFAFAMLLLLTNCQRKITSTPSTAAFYDMGVQYQRSDANGKDYFQVFGKGGNFDECSSNAKLQIVKTLIFDGYYKGVNYAPILSDSKQVAEFKDTEQTFYKKNTGNSSLVDAQKERDYDALTQSVDVPSQYSIKLTVGIDRVKLKKEVFNHLNIK